MKRQYWLLLGLLALLALLGAGPARAAGPGEWRNFPLPAPVTALAAAGENIWIGTTTGVIRLNRADGSMVTYTAADGLASGAVSVIAIDPEGYPWVGTRDEQVSRFDGQSWFTFQVLEAPEDKVFVSGLVFEAPGRPWFSLYGYGVTRGDEHFSRAGGLVDDFVLSMAANGEEIWIGTRQGLSRFSRYTWVNFTEQDGLTSSTITALAVDPAGNVWAGTFDAGVNRLDGQGWSGFTTTDGLPDNRINQVTAPAKGQAWVATPKGAGFFDGQGWTTYTTADGLIGDNVQAVTVDADGHTWFGTPQGLSEFVPPARERDINEPAATLNTYTTADGLADNRIWTIAVDPTGRQWAGTYDAGASVFDGQAWFTYTTADGLIDNDVKAILFAPDGRTWLGTGGGISVFDGQDWRSYTYFGDGLSSSFISGLAVDTAGNVWAATVSEGLNRLDGQGWRTYTSDDGLVDNFVLDIAADPAGGIWAATSAGVSWFDGLAWRSYTTANGLVNDTVFAVEVTPDGHKWFGTADGVSQFDGQRWTTHSPGWSVSDLAVGPDGRLWAAGSGRVSYFDGAGWTETLTGYFTGQDIRAVAVDPKGQVWVGTFGDGVAVFLPDSQAEAGPTVPVDFSGEWQSTNRNFPFGLTLLHQEDELKGWHCATLLNGSRTDCLPVDSGHYSITGTVESGVARVQVSSNYGGGVGQAVLTASNTGLQWRLVEPPPGEFYIPLEAVLVKPSNP